VVVECEPSESDDRKTLMGDEVTLAEITAETLERAQNLFAEDREVRRKAIWDSKRIPAFVGKDTTVEVEWFPFIKVRSLSSDSLKPILTKLAEVDPHGSKRIVQ
jgi:hypothetical protein